MLKQYNKLKDDLLRIGLIAGAIVVMIGCSQVTVPLEPVQVTGTQELPVSPNEGDTTQMIPPPPTSSNSSIQSLIEKAKQDLAQQLSISTDQITLVESMEVEWSDSSLDCPQPGMEYLQVLTPGYRILLEANGTQYEYHSNRDAYVVFCDNTNPPTLRNP